MVARKQLAQILGGRLGDAVDVLGHRDDFLRHPGRRFARRRYQRVAEHAGGAGVDERRDPGRGSFFQQIERARDVDVDKVLAAVGGHMRLVQRRGVQHGRDAPHALPNKAAVGDRARKLRERTGTNVDAEDFAALSPQGTDQGLAEMAGTAGHQSSHVAEPFALFARLRASGPETRIEPIEFAQQRRPHQIGRAHFRAVGIAE